MGLLKFVDHWAGVPICVCLGLLQKITHPRDRPVTRIPLAAPPRSIVVIKFFGLGSIILSSALLRSIKAAYPGARITFLTFKANADLVRRFPFVDEVRTADTRTPFTFLASTISNLVHFSFHKPDITIDLEFYSKYSTIVSYLTGARWRIGFHIAGLWRTLIVNVPVHFNYARHILEIYAMCGDALGASVTNLMPWTIQVRDEERARIERLFGELQIAPGSVLFGVNVNASDLALCRQWPKEDFARVITATLRDRPHARAVLTGSKSEMAYTSSVAALVDASVRARVIDLAGRLTFGEFLALLGKLRLLLTNDSGPFHLAKAVNLPTVSLWGPGSPDLYGPYGAEKAIHRVLYKRWPCSPCIYLYRTDAGKFCNGEIPCLTELRSDEVTSAVRDALESPTMIREA